MAKPTQPIKIADERLELSDSNWHDNEGGFEQIDFDRREVVADDPSPEDIDRQGGWPPRLRGWDAMERLDPKPGFAFEDSDQERLVAIASQHTEMQNRLVGRWRTLGCRLEPAERTENARAWRAWVTFYDYDTNELIEARVENDTVTAIRLGNPWQFPESKAEAAEAIQLARGHPALRERAAGLAGHALLSIPSARHKPGYGHRCLHVVFTETASGDCEQPVLCSALVDLSAGKVIAWEPARR